MFMARLKQHEANSVVSDSPQYATASPAAHERHTAAARHLPNAGHLLIGRNQACDILVSGPLSSREWSIDVLRFRQDLNSSVITGSKRIVDHTTFAELQWGRDPFAPDAFTLPPGFQRTSHLLSEDFVEVLKDIHALRCIRDSRQFVGFDTAALARIDNHQASIQSRLESSPRRCAFSKCCHLAAFLCAAMLRCKLWPASVIPVSNLLAM